MLHARNSERNPEIISPPATGRDCFNHVYWSAGGKVALQQRQ
jgi:hypothetical protein